MADGPPDTFAEAKETCSGNFFPGKYFNTSALSQLQTASALETNFWTKHTLSGAALSSPMNKR